MEEFWAICEMVQQADPEFGTVWMADIAARYPLQLGEANTNSGLHGEPSPGYCLFHGIAEAAVVEEVRNDAAVTIFE